MSKSKEELKRILKAKNQVIEQQVEVLDEYRATILKLERRLSKLESPAIGDVEIENNLKTRKNGR
jgi:hypothetical protein